MSAKQETYPNLNFKINKDI